MKHDLNPNKDDKAGSPAHSVSDWNLDPRNESYYLGKINESGDSDLNMRYYTDGETGRFYRKGEIIRQEETGGINKEPYRNNSFEGKRNKNFSFGLPGKRKRKEN